MTPYLIALALVLGACGIAGLMYLWLHVAMDMAGSGFTGFVLFMAPICILLVCVIGYALSTGQ